MTNLTEPEWLRTKVDARLAFMLAQMGGRLPTMGQHVILTPLTEPGEYATRLDQQLWERTCDNCGVYCPDNVDFYTGSTHRIHEDLRIEFTFGACAACALP